MNLLIIDNYNISDRNDLLKYNISLAYETYINVISKYFKLNFTILLGNDEDIEYPINIDIFDGVIWTGSGDISDRVIEKQIKFSTICFDKSIPQYGSCWGLQLAALTVGCKTRYCLRGREQGITRRIRIKNDSEIYKNKPNIFDGFVSHNDEIYSLNKKVKVLSSNDHCIQSIEVKHKNGVFWGTQYHPEYNFDDMSKLLLLRKSKCINIDEQYIDELSIDMKNMNKSIAWKLGLFDDILDDKIRELELYNFCLQL